MSVYKNIVILNYRLIDFLWGQRIMRTTWTDTIQSEVTSLVTYPVAKDTGRWQAAKNLAPMPNVRVGLVVRTTEKSVTRGWEYC